jgi:hypothetical protein
VIVDVSIEGNSGTRRAALFVPTIAPISFKTTGIVIRRGFALFFFLWLLFNNPNLLLLLVHLPKTKKKEKGLKRAGALHSFSCSKLSSSAFQQTVVVDRVPVFLEQQKTLVRALGRKQRS